MKDLSDPKAPLQTRVVKHSIVRGIQTPATRIYRQRPRPEPARRHLWDGQLARVSISRGRALQGTISFSAQSAPSETRQPPRLDLRRGRTEREVPLPELYLGPQRPPPAPPTSLIPPRLLAAMSDYCHALLISNEFLYLH